MRRSPSPRRGLRVTVRTSAGDIVAIDVRGHAGFAPAGRDIVCAAVSALILSGAHGVKSHCKARARVVDEPDGDYHLELPGGGNARAQAVLLTVVSGLRAIRRAYPQRLSIRTVAGMPSRTTKRSGPVRAARK